MLGEKLVRHSVTPISSAMETNRCSKTSKAIGSMRIAAGSGARVARRDQVGERIEAEAEAGRNHRGGFPAGDDGGPLAFGADREIAPAMEGGRHGGAAEARAAHAIRLGPARGRVDTRQGRLVGDADGD